MYKVMNIFMKAAMAVFAIVLAAGCISEKDMVSSVNAKDVMVMLNVSAGGMQTKAIDESAVNTIRIFAFDQSGNKVGHVYSSSAGSSFHMILSVPDGQESMTVDFYAIANEETMYYDDSAVTLSDNLTIDELNAIVYSSLITTDQVMPLYGKSEDVALALTSGSVHRVDSHTGFLLTESVDINLSRSLAKIGVYAAARTGVTADPKIHSVTFKSSGRRNISYLFPASDETALKDRDAAVSSLLSDRVFDLDADGSDVLSNGGLVSSRMSAQNTDPDEVGLYTEIVSPFYLAEVPFGSPSWDVAADPAGRPAVLVIEYSLGTGTVMKYATVNMPPIERNAYYQVRCLIKADGQLLVNVSVAPWTAGEDWTLDFDFPTHNDPLYKTGNVNTEGNYIHTYKTPATAYYKDGAEDGAFSVDFNMSYPIGGSWKPIISDAANTMFDLRLYERGSNVEISDPNIIVNDTTKDKWYTIKVVPLASGNVGQKVTLSISYTAHYLGGDYSYLLQINGGEENNLAWTEHNPISGDVYEASTVDIVVTQVDQN